MIADFIVNAMHTKNLGVNLAFTSEIKQSKKMADLKIKKYMYIMLEQKKQSL